MKKRLISTLFLLLFFTLTINTSVMASVYKSIDWTKRQYGNYYVWSQGDNRIVVQQVGKSKISKLRKSKDYYGIGGVTNGNMIYYTTLKYKFAGKVTLYKYNLKTGKQKKIGVIDRSLHIVARRGDFIYLDGADNYGHYNGKVYRYSLKTGKKKLFLTNFNVCKSSGKYMYGYRNNKKFRYDIATGKMQKMNWKD